MLIKPYYATTFPIIKRDLKKHFQTKSLARGNIYIFCFRSHRRFT